MRAADRLGTYLHAYGVEFEIRRHPAAFTAQEVAASEHVSGRQLAKVVMVSADGELVMMVLPATERLHLAKARAALSARNVRLATEAEFAPKFPDCVPGAMPPFGKLYGMRVFVDSALAHYERIVFQAGTHELTMSIRYADFLALVEPTVVELALEIPARSPTSGGRRRALEDVHAARVARTTAFR